MLDAAQAEVVGHAGG
ncbi:hypothetical protein, partial [Frankia sp. EI5c]